jgi:cell division protein ZapA
LPTVEITVNGRQHQVQVDPGQEHRARRLASYVDGFAAKLGQQHGTLPEGKLFLLTSILIADEYADALDELKKVRAALEQRERAQGSDAAAAIDRVAARLERLATALEKA